LKSKNPEDLKRKKEKDFVYNPISNSDSFKTENKNVIES
jgi:hypothetical protein